MAHSAAAVAIHARVKADPATPSRTAKAPGASATGIRIDVHDDLAAIEHDWRAFERAADGTVFQCFDYLATFQQHVGQRQGVRPAIVTGRDNAGALVFLLPLAVRPDRFARKLEFLGSDLCDYNGPLLAPGAALGGEQFAALWPEITRVLQAHPALAFDVVNLSKMPEQVGAQPNPMLGIGVIANPSNAYLTRLEGTWETFYAAKRSSSTRRRDRTKRKRLGDLGAVRLVTPAGETDIAAALDTLMAQKTRSFARMGVANIFANPGWPDFFRALATGPGTRAITHVSRLDVGAIPAAINLGLEFRGRYYHLLASYDDGETSRFGSGAAHLHDLMQYAIERGCNVFDFTIGDESYKRDWSDTVLKLHDHVSAVTPRGALVAGPVLAVRRLKRWIKQTPLVWNAVSKARAFMGSLRARGGDRAE